MGFDTLDTHRRSEILFIYNIKAEIKRGQMTWPKSQMTERAKIEFKPRPVNLQHVASSLCTMKLLCKKKPSN